MNVSKPSIRLYIPHAFTRGQALVVSESQAHYLLHVMRLRDGDSVAIFNGTEGVWRAQLQTMGKKSAQLLPDAILEPQRDEPDGWFAFAAIKHKTELMIEKATELGAAKILPVVTAHSVVNKLKSEKLQTHAIEAAEQCERHSVPTLAAYEDFARFIGDWPKDRTLFYGDESGGGAPMASLFSAARPLAFGALVGPEGGFSKDEHHILRAAAFARPVSLGPRVLKADTAGIALFSALQAAFGDGDRPCKF